jgi:hypothetical protein
MEGTGRWVVSYEVEVGSHGLLAVGCADHTNSPWSAVLGLQSPLCEGEARRTMDQRRSLGWGPRWTSDDGRRTNSREARGASAVARRA